MSLEQKKFFAETELSLKQNFVQQRLSVGPVGS